MLCGGYNSNYPDFRPSGKGGTDFEGTQEFRNYMGNFDRVAITSTDGILGAICGDHDGVVAGQFYTLPDDKTELIRALNIEEKVREEYDEEDLEKYFIEDLVQQEFDSLVTYGGLNVEDFQQHLDLMKPIKDTISGYGQTTESKQLNERFMEFPTEQEKDEYIKENNLEKDVDYKDKGPTVIELLKESKEDVDAKNIEAIKDILQKSGITSERTLDLMSKDILNDLKRNYTKGCKDEYGNYYGTVITDAFRKKVQQITGKMPDLKIGESKEVITESEDEPVYYNILHGEDNKYTLLVKTSKRIKGKESDTDDTVLMQLIDALEDKELIDPDLAEDLEFGKLKIEWPSTATFLIDRGFTCYDLTKYKFEESKEIKTEIASRADKSMLDIMNKFIKKNKLDPKQYRAGTFRIRMKDIPPQEVVGIITEYNGMEYGFRYLPLPGSWTITLIQTGASVSEKPYDELMDAINDLPNIDKKIDEYVQTNGDKIDQMTDKFNYITKAIDNVYKAGSVPSLIKAVKNIKGLPENAVKDIIDRINNNLKGNFTVSDYEDVQDMVVAKLQKIKEFNESKELKTEAVSNEEVDKAFDEIVYNDGVIYGQLVTGEYADICRTNYYDRPEDYDGGYLPEFGGSQEKLDAAIKAYEDGDVYIIDVVDKDDIDNIDYVYAYIYGDEDLKEYLKNEFTRFLKVKKSLPENKQIKTEAYSKDELKNFLNKGETLKVGQTQFKIVDNQVCYYNPSFTFGWTKGHDVMKTVDDLVNHLDNLQNEKYNIIVKDAESKSKTSDEMYDLAKNTNVKEWYKNTFPQDELGDEINPNITFYDVFEALDHYKDIYELLGVDDSVVREKVFFGLDDILDAPDGYSYEQWEFGLDAREKLSGEDNK